MKGFLFSVFLLCTGSVFAQLPEYYVYLLKGQATIDTYNNKGVKMKLGALLYKADQVKVTDQNTSITLLNHDDFFVEINKPGLYKVEDLMKLKRPEHPGITKTYLEFIWKELFNGEKDRNSLAKMGFAGSWGGVYRGACGGPVLPLDGSCLASDTIIFTWDKSHDSKKYFFSIMDSLKREIISVLVFDTSFGMLKRNLLAETKGSFYWCVRTAEDKCAPLSYKLHLVDKVQASGRIESLISQIPENPDLVMYNLMISDLLKKEGWYNEAWTYFLKAARFYNGN